MWLLTKQAILLLLLFVCFLFISTDWACFHFWTCAAPQKNGKCDWCVVNVLTETVRGSGGVLRGLKGREKDRNRVVCLVYFELHYPYYRWVSTLHLPLDAEDAGGPLRIAPINLSQTIYPSVCPLIHQLIWRQSTQSVPLFLCLSPIFQIISPSKDPSMKPSSSLSIHPFIPHHSSICLSFLTQACFRLFPVEPSRLNFSCFWPRFTWIEQTSKQKRFMISGWGWKQSLMGIYNPAKMKNKKTKSN